MDAKERIKLDAIKALTAIVSDQAEQIEHLQCELESSKHLYEYYMKLCHDLERDIDTYAKSGLTAIPPEASEGDAHDDNKADA